MAKILSSNQTSYLVLDGCVDILLLGVFQINVGCSSESSDAGPVRLEYSMNAGRTWQTVQSPCSAAGSTMQTCSELEIPSTVYYPGTSSTWRRIVVPLSGLQICG